MNTRLTFLLALLLGSLYSCKTEPKSEPTATSTEVRQWQPEDLRDLNGLTAQRGLVLKTDKASQGYVLFQPTSSNLTFLIDKDGTVVHSWAGDYSTVHSYLLPNGHLMRLEKEPNIPIFHAGGLEGRIREYDWDGNLIWDFKYADENQVQHHDIEILPNGDILAVAYEVKTEQEALDAGKDPEHLTTAGLWVDKIIEIKPTRPEGGEIVWEWHLWDHLVQDLDPDKDNYGVLTENPRKFDVNTTSSHDLPHLTEEQIAKMKEQGSLGPNVTFENQHSEVTHGNSLSYNAELDQIAVNFKYFNELYIIDHSTTTEEAKGSSGGRWGHGGDILYRWGNPQNYGRGTAEDRKLFVEHDVKFIPKGYPGENHLLMFDNDIVMPGNKLPSIGAAFTKLTSPKVEVAIEDIGNYSAVYEIVLPTSQDGTYIIPEKEAIGPKDPIWSYTAPDKYSLYSPFVSGAQRLINGNTLIASGASGRIFEVTPEKEIVWEYWNPYFYDYKMEDGSSPQPVGPFKYMIFRGTQYTPDYPAFKGKELKPIQPQPEPFIFKMPPSPPVTAEEGGK